MWQKMETCGISYFGENCSYLFISGNYFKYISKKIGDNFKDLRYFYIHSQNKM